MKSKIKYKVKKIRTSISNMISFPAFWVSIVIMFLSIMSLFISLAFEKSGKEYGASIFNNIFTGLITGLALSLLSGVKSVYVAYMEARLNWLEGIHKMIIDQFNEEKKLWLLKNKTDEIFYDTAYDTISKANWVNDKIIQSTYEKVKWFEPNKYFKKHYNYDCFEVKIIMSEMRDYLIYECSEPIDRKMVKIKLREVTNILSDLNRNILFDIDSIRVKIASAKKSLI